MQKRSIIFRNRLASPIDTAMYWIDHVLEHKDVPYLKSASMKLKWYEWYSLDVLTLLVILLVATFYALKFILLKFIFALNVIIEKIQTWFDIASKPDVTRNNFKTD